MIKMLLNEGFKYMYIPKRSKKSFYVTKSESDFYNDDTEYTEVKVTEDYEAQMLKILPKNAFLDLSKLCV